MFQNLNCRNLDFIKFWNLKIGLEFKNNNGDQSNLKIGEINMLSNFFFFWYFWEFSFKFQKNILKISLRAQNLNINVCMSLFC